MRLFSIVFKLQFGLFSAIAVVAANKMHPSYQQDSQNEQVNEPVSMDDHSSWVNGPANQKYQFHIGKQSWLAAREKCLAQNADLATIESKEELHWLLTHYKPQFRNLRERQVQIGLLLEAPDGDGAQAREWRWVNGQPLDVSKMQWTQGEPFDHAKGKERCGVLNINEQRIDDIDCDLSAGPEFNYRFVCQRSNEKHVEHESLNNPLWKKLEDILTFFGISSSDSKNESLSNGLDEEGYWNKVFNNGTNGGTNDGTNGGTNIVRKKGEESQKVGQRTEEEKKQKKEGEERGDDTKGKGPEKTEEVGAGAGGEQQASQNHLAAPPTPDVKTSDVVPEQKEPSIDLLKRVDDNFLEAASTDANGTLANEGTAKEAKQEDVAAESKSVETKDESGAAKQLAADDRHQDGLHSSSEGLEILSEKKANELPAAANDPTVILLASAEEGAISENTAKGGESNSNGTVELSAGSNATSTNETLLGSEQSIVLLPTNNDNGTTALDCANCTGEIIGAGQEEASNNSIVSHIGQQSRLDGEQRDNDSTVVVDTVAAAPKVPVAKPEDPLMVVARTLERSLTSKEEEKKQEEAGAIVLVRKKGNEVVAEKEAGELNSNAREEKEGKEVHNRIQHLERIIDAMQQMMLGLEGGLRDEKAVKTKKEKTKEEEVPRRKEAKQKHEQELTKLAELDLKKEARNEVEGKVAATNGHAGKEAEEDGREIRRQNGNGGEGGENKKTESRLAFVPEEKKELSSSVERQHISGGWTGTAVGGNGSDDSAHESMLAMESDFEEAEREAKAHPGINSGDLVKNIIAESDELQGDSFESCEEEKCENGKDNEGDGAPSKRKDIGIVRSRFEKYGAGRNAPRTNSVVGTNMQSLTLKRAQFGAGGKNGSAADPTAQANIGAENERRVGEGKNSVQSKPASDWILQLNGASANSTTPPSPPSTSNNAIPSSIFPRPNFDLIRNGVPPEVQQNLLEEQRRVDAVYEQFNTKESIYDLIRRIQQAELANAKRSSTPLAVNQSSMASAQGGERKDHL